MKKFILAAAISFLAFPAFALDLQQARAQGLVGEQTDGYVGVIKAGAEVQSLVADINARRRQEYTRISKENGQPLEVVAKLAVPQIVQNLPSGSLYQSSSGQWVKK